MPTGYLTTYVLDTVQGRPAGNVLIELWSLDALAKRRILLKVLRTNAHGSTEEPLLSNDAMEVGIYEIVFAVGDYFTEQHIPATLPPFLDRIPVRFGLADPDAHYHVPLLVSPWAYSTYCSS